MPDRDQALLAIFARVLALLDEAGKAASSKEKASYQILLWKSAAEAEYLAFRLSTGKSLTDYDPAAQTNRDDGSDVVDVARALLRDGQSAIDSNPRRAYEAVRRAVSVLRRAYASNEKLSRSGSSQSPENG